MILKVLESQSIVWNQITRLLDAHLCAPDGGRAAFLTLAATKVFGGISTLDTPTDTHMLAAAWV
jgi:hypothetical protein